jgi:hypothetical protein
MWWCKPIILALRRLEFEVSMGYIVRPCFKKRKEVRKTIGSEKMLMK